MHILVTGGAGYIGSVLCPMLLERGHKVIVLDNLTFGLGGILNCFTNKNFDFIKGDIRNTELVKTALARADVVIHLAAIVGYPACQKDERMAYEVNYLGTKNIADNIVPGQTVFFASTGSNYGYIPNSICTEETPLNPLTTYGRTKTEAEKYLLDTCSTVAYRFATAFGISPRLRLDLMINDFVYQAIHTKNLIVYEKTFGRTFIHVRDIAQSFIFALDNLDKMRGEVFNVGSESMNYTKEAVANKIREKIEFYLHFAEIGKDADQRNYQVSYKKINALGFTTSITLEEGIEELIRIVKLIEFKHPYNNL